MINRIIIIDNNSILDEWSILNKWIAEQKKDHIRAIRLDKNIGYFKAINQGLLYLGDDVKGNYTIVGNNDLEFASNFCKVLLSKKINNNVVVIAPNIQNSNGSTQNPYYINRISKKRKFFLSIYYWNYYLSNFMLYTARKINLSKLNSGKKKSNLEQPIFAGHGSCYILTDNFFHNENRLLRSESFLYGEELFLSYQVKQIGGIIIYSPDLVVFHKEHSSMLKMPSKLLFSYMQEGFKNAKKYM